MRLDAAENEHEVRCMDGDQELDLLERSVGFEFHVYALALLVVMSTCHSTSQCFT
jgi:hypothetical protein